MNLFVYKILMEYRYYVFKDKRDVLMLTTFSDNSMLDKINDFKPRLISAYNNGKVGVDLNDQNSHYSSVLRRSKKCFIKFALYLLFNLAVNNSFILYKKLTTLKWNIVDFQINIIKELLTLFFQK